MNSTEVNVFQESYFYGFECDCHTWWNSSRVCHCSGSWHDSKECMPLRWIFRRKQKYFWQSYTDYAVERLMKECENIWHDSERKSNNKRTEPLTKILQKSNPKTDWIYVRSSTAIPRNSCNYYQRISLKLKFYLSFTFKTMFHKWH